MLGLSVQPCGVAANGAPMYMVEGHNTVGTIFLGIVFQS